MFFSVDVQVKTINKTGRLEWSSDEFSDLPKLIGRLLEQLESLTEMLDWEVPEDPQGPFWAKSPVDLAHKLAGSYGRGASGRIGDKDRLRGWVEESAVIYEGSVRGLPTHHVQLLQWWAFTLWVKDPIEFAKSANPEKLIEEYWEDNEWAEGVREREEF